MEWLWLLLRCLFPRDPVKQAAEAARHCIARLVALVENDDALLGLRECEQSRAYVEAITNDYEASVHFAIAMRACQIAGIAFRAEARPFHQPSKPKSVAELLCRIAALAKLCADIERLAQLRAIDLKRQHDADPLAAHGSTDAALCAAAHHELVDVSLKSQIALILSSTRSVRPSKDERGLTGSSARAPPIFDVSHHPQLISEAPLLGPRPLASAQAIPLTPPRILGMHS